MKDFLYSFLIPFAFSIIAPFVMVAAACAAFMGAAYLFLFIFKALQFLWSIVF